MDFLKGYQDRISRRMSEVKYQIESAYDWNVQFPDGVQYCLPANFGHYLESGWTPPDDFQQRIMKGGEIKLKILEWHGSHTTNVGITDEIRQQAAARNIGIPNPTQLTEVDIATMQQNTPTWENPQRRVRDIGFLHACTTPDGASIVVESPDHFDAGTAVIARMDGCTQEFKNRLTSLLDPREMEFYFAAKFEALEAYADGDLAWQEVEEYRVPFNLPDLTQKTVVQRILDEGAQKRGRAISS